MSKRFVEFYIVDILTAIDKIKRYTYGFKDATEFAGNEKSFDAVMRELEIIGEATKNVLTSEEVKHLAKPEWRMIVDFRNVIVHEYFGIDIDEVFKVVREDIEVLEKEMLELIGDIKDRVKLKEALECAVEDLRKMHRKESIDYLLRLIDKLKMK